MKQSMALKWMTLTAVLLAAGVAVSQGGAPSNIVVRIVAADMPDRLISDLESLVSVEDPNVVTILRQTQATQSMGEDATLWVAGARVNGTNTFERYYKGVFTRRTSELAFEPGRLGVGDHVIDPGHHVFTVDKDGKLSSTDPDITIDGRTVTLKAYRIEIMNVDADKSGPPENRLLGRKLNVYETLPGFNAASNRLNDAHAKNTLWYFRDFCPLRLYLPANTNAQAYLLQPGSQAFRVLPGGTIELQGKTNAAIKAEGSRLLVSYLSYSAWVNTKTGLGASFAGVSVPRTDGTPARIRVGPTPSEPVFSATVEGLSSSFGLTLSGDLDRYPNKFMVAENTRDPMAVRMMALESGICTFERGSPAVVRLQFKENFAALKLDDLQNAGALIAALRTANATSSPLAKDDPLAAQVRRVCQYVLTTTKAADAEILAQWLASANATNRANIIQGGISVFSRLNGLLNDRLFFNAAALADLKADEALCAEAARMATLSDDAVQRVNRRILDVVFPGVFASLAAGEPKRPEVRMAYSPYDPLHFTSRSWTFFPAQSWEGDTLTFKTPDLPYGFYIFRVMLFGQEDVGTLSPLMAEFACCVIEPKQDGTACFVSNKGRDAFVAGETIRLQAVLRSRGARSAGSRTVVLTHPDGREDRLTMEDPGGKWHSQALSIPDSITRRMLPGRYELTMTDLPQGVACYPFRFDMAAPRESLFRMIKASKYTFETYAILGSQSGETPIDLDRAMASMAELGYNRFDYHTYSSDHHNRRGEMRSIISEADERLMPPDAIYLPSGRDQILNACVRYGLEYGDVLHGAGDNEIPRYIDAYINAGERWIRREVTSMRHSPAYDGQYLYEESYERGLVGVPKKHDNFFPSWRLMRARQAFPTNMTPNQIRAAGSRNVSQLKTAPDKWDPKAMEWFLELRKWEMHGWGDFNTRLASAGRELLPRARMGTYHCSFMFVQNGYGAIHSAADFDNGYHPNVLENLDIASSQHYHDGPTIGHWAHAPIMIPLMRESPVGGKRLVWANISMNADARTLSDGQLQRQMAFAMLAQGADGISTFHMHETFADEPNPNMIKSKETMRWLNKEIMAPFGEVFSRATKPGYLKVGIVNTLAQLSMSEFKPIRTANQLEELWIACWRLGYPAVFLREGDMEKSLDGYQVIFVPGIRFPGELTASALDQLRAAIKRGCKVVVERDSTLDAQIAGVTKMQDFDLMNYYLGPGFNVAGYDAELDKVFALSQPCTDYLRTKMVEWGVEPTARGPFAMGPNWRDGGDIQYLIMANYDDPDYGQTCRDIMSKPVRMPLTVPARRGEVAYDLLARTELPLGQTTNSQERSLVLDMTRVQGAMAAFLPEKIAAIRAAVRRDTAGTSLLLNGTLIGESGKVLSGVFPARIRILNGKGQVVYSIYRALNSKGELELDVPLTSGRDPEMSVEVVENISGMSCRIPIETSAGNEGVLRLDDAAAPHVPYPVEIARFLKSNTNALLVLGRGLEGSKADVDRLIAGLGAKGMKVTLMPENRVWRLASGDSGNPADPFADGFHHWHGGMGGSDGGIIEPRAVVDSPLIIVSASHGSALLNTLTEKGFVTERPVGALGVPVQPTLQVASRGLHWKYDTLLLVANDAEGVRRAVSRILEDPALTGTARPADAAPKLASYGQPVTKEGRDTAAQTAATNFKGNNEYIIDMKFDAAGNIYVITWGHGDNLYSLDTKGNLRFSRRLPEMGACRLDVDTDRVVVFTSYGSRLYQVALDGKPISQVRLTLDPGVSHKGPTYREVHTHDLLKHGLALYEKLFRYAYVPGKQMVVSYEPLLETMRALDKNGSLVAEWRGESRTDADGNVSYRELGEFVCSPDGTRVAEFEDGILMLRDLTDTNNVRKLAERYDAGNPLSWQKGAPGPTAGRTHFDGDLEVVRVDLAPPVGTAINLEAAGGLIPDGKDFRLVRGDKEISRMGPFPWTPTFAQVSPDGATVVLLDEYWNAFVHEVATGKRTGQIRLPEMGFSVVFTPDSKAFLVGGLRGSVMCCDLSSRLLWSTSLAPHNQSLQKTAFPNVDATIPDFSDKLFKPTSDEPGELDKLVTLDRSRLKNGDFEGEGGWRVDTNVDAKAVVSYVDGGYQGKRCLKVGNAPVQQQVEGLIGDHFTWVLEFFHRRSTPEHAVRLLAGAESENRHSDSVVRVLECGKDWAFARIVFKSGADPKALRVGFQGQGGDALVDGVSLRRIRFPSVNHMLYPPLYDVEPVILKNPLFLKDYNPLGVLSEQIPNVILSQRPQQIADSLLVDAFLQNGRLNDISSQWHWSYLENSDTQLSMGIKNPRWVSMVAIYFNEYDAANIPRHFDVFVSDMMQKKVVRVASIRNNRSLFRLITFPPRRADEVRVTLVNRLPREQTVTELEVYGPLSGGEKEGVSDAAAQNTYMGSFARVDKRRLSLASGYESKSVGGSSSVPRWATPVSQIMMSERTLYLSRSLGFNQRYPLDTPSLDAPAESFRTGGMGFGPVVTLSGGALLKPGSDGRLWCIDPTSGRAFWSTVIGERLTGSPAVNGMDVYMATDAGKLYTLDIASGAILGETRLSGPVYGSVALEGTNLFVITSAGRLHAIEMTSGQERWPAVPVAMNTESTPAVSGGVVYLADQKGVARAVRSVDGTVLWSRELGSEFCRCPVVTEPNLVVFGCSDGRLTALNSRTGDLVWQTQVDTRFLRYEPVAVLMPPPPPSPSATNSVAVSATATTPDVSVLLCLSGGKPMLIDLATGKPAERQMATGSVQKDGTFKQDVTLPSIGELTAPISVYTGYVGFVTIDGDIADGPMFNDSRYHNMGSGSAKLLKPIGDTAPRSANAPRVIVRIEKPVRLNGLLADGEWGEETLSLDGPDDIFPTERRAKKGADGSIDWNGYDDLGAKVYIGCDSNALYLAAVVTDDTHLNSSTGDKIFRGDIMQVGIVTKNVHWNLGLARTQDGPQLYQAEGSTSLANKADFGVTRDSATTSYELRLPLADLGLAPGMEFGMNIVFLDDDKGSGPRYRLQLAPGLDGFERTTSPEKVYPRFVLPK
jgi:outer membrane protein assembly factor BamB